MHYLQGRHRWIVAIAISVVLIAVAVTSHAARQQMVPMAPGPISTPTPIGDL